MDGSSISTSGGLPISACATDSLRLLPPEREFAFLLSYCLMPMSSMRYSITSFRSALGTPLIRPNSSKCSRTVSRSSSACDCGHMPSRRRTFTGSFIISIPHRMAVPEIMEKVVVFPAPLIPNSPKHSPRDRPNVIRSTATFSPLYTLRSCFS